MQPNPASSREGSHYWFGVNQALEEVSGFLTSLNTDQIDKGFVLYDEANFKLSSRSMLSGNPTFQWIVNWRNPQAKFRETKRAFEALNSKVSFVWGQILNFHPKKGENCSQVCLEVMRRLCGEIPGIISERAAAGLERLSGNYFIAGKLAKSDMLNELGKKAFKGLARSGERLITVLVLQLPDPKAVCPFVPELSALLDRQKDLQEVHERSRTAVRHVTWNPKTGLIIPHFLVSAYMDESNKVIDKRICRLKANLLRYPSNAQHIPAQGGESYWQPLRPIRREGKAGYEIMPGVAGTCERDGLGSIKICNLYYRIDPLTGHLVMSCGSIDSEDKAEQLAVAMAFIQAKRMGANKREKWLIHSFSHAPAFSGVSHLPDLQNELRKQNKEIPDILHLHTLLVDNPNHHSHFESLPFLIKCVMQEAERLLNGRVELAFLAKEESYLTQQWGQLVAITRDLQQLNPLERIVEKQNEFRAELEKLAKYFEIAIQFMENIPRGKNTLPLEQALLLFKVLRQILLTQFQSPIIQIEWCIFLYRLLDLNVVLVSKSGLNEASVVSAIADTQSQLERNFCREQKKESPEAWLTARRKLFDLLMKLPEGRDNIFRRLSSLTDASLNIRLDLMKDIDQSLDKVMLQFTLHYLELVTTHLLSTEAEKDLNSGGIRGLHMKRDELLKRVAPFAFSEERVIPLSDLGVNKDFDSVGITDMGKALL